LTADRDGQYHHGGRSPAAAPAQQARTRARGHSASTASGRWLRAAARRTRPVAQR